MNIEIANRLLQLRKQNNLSQEELAFKLGISRQAVSKWERAEASPDTDNLINLAKLYNVSLDELLKSDEFIEGNDIVKAEDYEYRNQNNTNEDLKDYDYIEIDEEIPKSKVILNARVKNIIGTTISIIFVIIAIILKTDYPTLNLYGAYPILVTIVYLILGFTVDYWHPGWILYLTIPLFYILQF